MLAQMAAQAATERKKSILGQIQTGKDQTGDGSSSAKKDADGPGGPSGDVARANLISRMKELAFFSLEESECKLKRADWLPYVCWQPAVAEVVKR